VTLRRYHQAAAVRLAWGMAPAAVAKALGVRLEQIEHWLRDPRFRACYSTAKDARDQAAARQVVDLPRRAAALIWEDLRSTNPTVALKALRASRRHKLAERFPDGPIRTVAQQTPKRLTPEQKRALYEYLEATRNLAPGEEVDERLLREVMSADVDRVASLCSLFIPGKE
jgi:hypothetical protein